MNVVAIGVVDRGKCKLPNISRKTMEEIINNLAHLLEQIEQYHGVAGISANEHVQHLHQQAREHIAEMRKMVAELKPETIKPGYYNVPVTQLKFGDIFCPPSGNPPGIITRIYRDPLTASNEYPMVTFEYEGELCGKRICDIRQDQIVRVYRGNREDAELAWTTKYETKEM